MKIEEFNKLKRLAESIEKENLSSHPESQKIYEWMVETGRIDEGILGTIWSWMKRNLSIRSRRIHILAKDFANELMEEGRAEYNKTSDKASKFRAGTYNKLSRDIEEKMEILAADDDDYRELVRLLVNKKTIEVKKALLIEFAGKLDSDEEHELRKGSSDHEEDRVDREYKEHMKKMSVDKAPQLEKILKFVSAKISSEKSVFKDAKIVSPKEINEFALMIAGYVNFLSEKDSKVEFDNKTFYNYCKKYVFFVKEMIKYCERNYTDKHGEPYYDENETIFDIKDFLDSVIKSVKPVPLEKNKDVIFKMIKDEFDKKFKEDTDGKEEDNEEDSDDIITDLSDEIVDIDKAEKEAKTHKTDFHEEVEEYVEELFSKKGNLEHYTEILNDKIEEYNSLAPATKRSIIDKYNYKFSSSLNIKLVKEEDIENLLKSFTKIVGKIVPYYLSKHDKKEFIKVLLRFIFEIYLYEKETDKVITDDDSEHIVKNIREKNPEMFK